MEFDWGQYFDRASFWRDIQIAQRSPEHEEPTRRYIRQRGLRFIVQTTEVMESESVLARVREIWGAPQNAETRIERLFEGFVDSATPDHLSLFHLIVIANVDPGALANNVYDACYALLALREIQSVEPDLPYLGFLSRSAGLRTAKSPPPKDKAWALRNMKVDQAWQLVPPMAGDRFGKGARIAHLDTGWTNHDDLDQSNFWPSGIKDFIDPSGGATDPMKASFSGNPGHGTRTGSVMMSRGGVSPGSTSPPGEITGVAPSAAYAPIRCVKSVIVIYAADIAKAVHHATGAGCHVVSMSIGGRPAKALRHAIKDAVANNLIVLAAAGNNVRAVVWPAAYSECIALAASNERDRPWKHTSRGRAVDVSAPGEDVWVAEPTKPPSGVDVGSGTSYATAHTAGVAALWLSFFGRNFLASMLRNGVFLQEVFRAQIKATSRAPTGWDKKRFGAGIVDALQLLGSAPQFTTRPGFASHWNPIGFWRWSQLNLLSRTAIGDDDASMLSVFEHELANFELDEADRREGHTIGYRGWTNLSQTLQHWLSRQIYP